MKTFKTYFEAFSHFQDTMFGDQCEACADYINTLLENKEIEILDCNK